MSMFARAQLVLVALLWVGASARPVDAQFAIRGRIATRGQVKRDANGNVSSAHDARATLVEYDDNGGKHKLCSDAVFPTSKCTPTLAQASGVTVGSLEQACATQPNPTDCKAAYAGAVSVLFQGNEILYASKRLIAYETELFTIDPNEPAAGGAPANCIVDESKLPPDTNVNLAHTLSFVQCNTPSMNVNGESRVWAPISGAYVEMINFGIYRAALTNAQGYFEIPYRARVNEYENFDLNAIITYGSFEPRAKSPKKFYLTASAISGYVYQPGQAYYGLTAVPNYSTDPAGSLGTLYANMPLEAVFLTVNVQFENCRPSKNVLSSEDACASAGPIPVTGYPSDQLPTGITRYSNVDDQHGQIGFLSAISTPDLRDTEIYVYRVADGKLIGSRWGMTSSEVTGSDCGAGACLQASMLMRGPASLYLNHAADRFNPTANTPPVRDASGNVVTAGRFGIELDYGHGLSSGNTPFLREGDQAKIIAVNRATGYIGSTLVKMQRFGAASGTGGAVPVTPGSMSNQAQGTMTFVPVGQQDALGGIVIKLRPPNLKVTVTRETEIKSGATIKDGKERDYIIGFEGSGLTDDKLIRIDTEWYDADGSALPEDLPGFTGRLAMTVNSKGGSPEAVRLADGGYVEMVANPQDPGVLPGIESKSQPNVDRTGFFPIGPGNTPKIVRLPQGELDLQHFYLHVDAQPLSRNVNFMGRPGPAGPDFSVSQVCYQTCVDQDGTNTCSVGQPGNASWGCFPQSPEQRASEGALAQRPINYVPFQIPKYRDEDVKKVQSGAKNVPPLWLYRPEMQFSLFALEMQQLNLKNPEDGSYRNVLNTSDAVSSYGADTLINAIYTLKAPTNSALQDIDGTQRQLGFELGKKFVNVTFSPPPCTEEPCPDASTTVIGSPGSLAALGPKDYLALRLLQKDDKANVLWEYGFQELWIEFSDEHGKRITNLPVGKRSHAKVVLQPESEDLLSKVTWSIDRAETQRDVQIQIDPGTGDIWVPSGSAESYAVIQAKIGDSLFRKVTVQVGCACKSCMTPGACTRLAKHIDFTFSLGATKGKLSPGMLRVKRSAIDDAAYLRKSLELSVLDHETLETVGDRGGLRQIITPQAFVLVDDLDSANPAAGYTLKFYPPEARRAGDPDADTGLYSLTEHPPSPTVVWNISNPGPAPVDAGATSGQRRLRLTEIRDAKTTSDDYVEDTSTNDWTLDQADGLRIEQESEETVGGDHVVRNVVRDRTSTASTVDRSYHTFPWGEELVKEVLDPAGAKLTTAIAYYEDPNDVGSYGQIFYRIEPDGSWERYSYDDHRRIVTITRPWLDGPVDPATALGSESRVTQYVYTPVDPRDVLNRVDANALDYGFDRPRVTTERIAGMLTALSYLSIRAGDAGGYVEIEERCPNPGASFGDGSCLRTETRLLGGDTSDIRAGSVSASIEPNGRMDSYEYELGNWNGSSFVAGEGTALRTTVTHGTVSSPQGVANKTTREVSVVDGSGQSVREEGYIYMDGGYVLVSWTDSEYDVEGHLVRSSRSNGEVERATWGCCAETSSTDSRGIVTTYVLDDLKRVVSSTRAGVTTTYSYDAAGRELSVTRSGGGLALTSLSHYDGAGRLDQRVDEAQLSTSYAYALGGRVSTVTHPGGFTEITERYLDGQQKSVTGSSVVAQYFTYAALGDSTQVSEVRSARADSPAFERSFSDMLSRTVRAERPGFGGSLEVATSSYDGSGALVRSTASGSAATLYEYDELGQPTRKGLDVNGDDALDLASIDRITESDTQFVSADGAYWQSTTQRAYVDASSSMPKVTGVIRTRLTGFGGGLVREQVEIDLQGNETRSRVIVDSATATETSTTTVPDSALDAVVVSVNGRQVSSTSTTGLTVSYGYDGLGRRTTVTNPRTGASETHYDERGRVDYVKDAAGNATSFGYDSTSGRKIRETNALGKHTYFAYDPRGQLTRTWGDVPYPVQYGYDEYERRVEMQTYRVEAGWNTATWPESASGDTTRWHYDEATGLLQSKEDAAGRAVTYTYGPAGRVATRTWARPKSGGGALITSYAYHPATGELVGVDHNDDTPDVTYAYDRLGRQATVTDAVGTRVFEYDSSSLQLQKETIGGPTPVVLTRYYDPVGVKGRLVGIGLGSSYVVGYGYDSTGQLQSVGWTANGASDIATYDRVPASELLAGYATQSGFHVAYTYEPKRDLKTQVQNKFGANVVSQYDYGHDAIGRRTSVQNSGFAFGPTKFTSWGYDERNQVTASNRYTGAFTASPNPADEVDPERRDYNYDPIGNRATALDQDGSVEITYATNELNQYDLVGQQAPVHDEDGNLLNDGTKVLTYNAENQLKTVTVPGASVSTYDYDYLGRRVGKSVDVLDGSGPDFVMTWVYSGWNKVAERKTVSSATTVKNFVWGLDLSQSMQGAGGIGGLLAVADGTGSANLFSYDGNGNVSELVAAADGTVAAHYEYDAFGNTVLSSGGLASENFSRFSTKEADDETGLYYYGYRYYDDVPGRWVNRDPIDEFGGIALNLFVQNDPTDLHDLLGLELPPFPDESPRAQQRAKTDAEDQAALGVLMGARAVSGFQGYTLTAKFLGRYLSGEGDYRLLDDEMRFIRDDQYFDGTFGKVSRYVMEQVPCGKSERPYTIGYEHWWFKNRSLHLWSAFNHVHVDAKYNGTFSRFGNTLHFDGAVDLAVEDRWAFSDPSRAGREPFAQFDWLPDQYQHFKEGRFLRLEQRGWVHPFWIRGSIESHYTIDVDTRIPAANPADPQQPFDRGTHTLVLGL